MKKHLVLLSLLLFITGTCQAEIEHLIVSEKWTYQSVDSLIIEKRIKAAAQQYENYTIPRAAFYDNALPANITEYQDLDKNSILMVVSLVHNPQELPLKNVYVTYQGNKIALKMILTKTIDIKDKTVRKVFGDYRQDYFYLFPIYLQLKESQLTIDWAINREGFVIVKYPNPEGIPLDFVYKDAEIEKQSGNLKEDFLKQFLNREYSINLP